MKMWEGHLKEILHLKYFSQYSPKRQKHHLQVKEFTPSNTRTHCHYNISTMMKFWSLRHPPNSIIDDRQMRLIARPNHTQKCRGYLNQGNFCWVWKDETEEEVLTSRGEKCKELFSKSRL